MADPLEGVNPQLAEIARKILAESGGAITISSGRRSREEQQRLYERYRAGKGPLAAKPGTSRHEHGEAIDFGGDMELLARLGRKYGLSNSVPGEPWHWTLGGESGAHTERYSEYDLGEDTASNPQDVLGNRLHSVLRILGNTDVTASPGYEDPSVDTMFARSEEDGSVLAEQLASGEGQHIPQAATPKGQLQKYAAEKLKALGMGADEIGPLITLWNKESGWNPAAQNPTSTAYGIAQFLNSTWKGTGYEKTSDPYKQIDAGLSYIMGRYGSPSRALQFHLKNNWY